MNGLIKDLRYGTRSLLKNPGFALTVVITLALGIGANTTIFTIVNAVMLRPLPYGNSERLMKLNTAGSRIGERTSPQNFLDWRSQNQSFENLGGYFAPTAIDLSGEGEPERISGAMISETLFPALEVAPAIGRNFLAEEDRKGGTNVVILSHGLWVRRFGMDPQILGHKLSLNGRPYTVVGVMPSHFEFPSIETGLWIPFSSVYEDGGRGNFFVDVIGKLKPGVSIAQAQSDMDRIAANLEQQYPEVNNGSRISVVPLQEIITSKIRPTLVLLLGVVGFVLLIACANVANLLLSRAAGRQREIAVRAALGASSLRIIRQLLSESALLALIGGALGLAIAYCSVRALIVINPESIPRMNEITLDARVLAFTVVASILTCLLFGLAPAWFASRPDLNETLKEGLRGSSPQGSVLRRTLVVVEFALALLLLVGSGLMLRSFIRLLAVSPGFDTVNILTFDVALPSEKYSGDRPGQFFEEALGRIAVLPGVQSVGATTSLPFSRTNNGRYFTLEGRTGNNPGDYTLSGHRLVSSSYFQTLSIPLVEGRYLNDQDGPYAVVVNRTFARLFLPNQEPLGKRLKMGETSSSNFPWMTIVGVVQDIKHTSLDRETRAEIYRQYLHNKDAERQMTIAIRTSQPPESLITLIRREIQSLDRDQPLANVSTMQQLIDRSVARWRFTVLLMVVFAVIALTLAAVGVYGVMSYSVTQSRRELGIRMALGAQRTDVFKLVLGQGLMLTLIGLGLGLAGAFALTRFVTTLLFGINATDPATFVVVSLGLMVIAMFACYIPARRATKVDPLEALRYE
jgi:putative ABC transport system permease protein